MAIVQVHNGEIMATRLPTSGKLSDGSSVSNYLMLPADVLAAEGWVQATEVLPEYDPSTQWLVLDHYEVVEDTVNAIYRAEPLPPEEPIP